MEGRQRRSFFRPCVHRDRLIRRPRYQGHAPRATGYVDRTSAPPITAADNKVTAFRAEQPPVNFYKANGIWRTGRSLSGILASSRLVAREAAV
jgi:hypothetical protein